MTSLPDIRFAQKTIAGSMPSRPLFLHCHAVKGVGGGSSPKRTAVDSG